MQQGGHEQSTTPPRVIMRLGLGLAAATMCIVSAALVGLTFQIGSHPGAVPMEWQWNLRWEQNFAAWWSGSLLAIAAFLAFDNAGSEDSAALRRSWLTLALIILFLSSDEIGSFHERMGSASEAMGAGSWALAIPLGIVIAILSIKAGWTMLLHGGRERIQIITIAIGFAILLSVAVQEYFEHAIDWEANGLSAIRAMIEEGSELVGIAIVMLAVAIPAWSNPTRMFSWIGAHSRALMIGAMIAFLPCLAVSADLAPDKGYPSDWLASVLFLGAACLWLRKGWSGSALLVPILLSGLCLLGSIASVAVPYADTFGVLGPELSRRGLALMLVAVGALTLAGKRAGLIAIVSALAILLVPVSGALSHPVWIFVLGPICGLAAFWQASRMPEDAAS